MSFLSSLFGVGQQQQPVAAPVAPTVDNSQAQLDAAAEKQRQTQLAGSSSTVLTGGAGLNSAGTTTSQKLLGSA